MARSWWLGCEAWVASVGLFVLALLGAAVTNLWSTAAMAAVLAVPAVLAAAVAGYEWWTARAYGQVLEPLHLLGVGLGLLTWLIYPTAPGDLPFNPSSDHLCRSVGQAHATGCLARADAARLHSHLAWISTGVLIFLLALLTRRSRTAAWATPAVALAGAAFALHFLEAFVRSYE